jgi:ArsR family transcriptional regulator, arsenate/arsenite/antimonite-responsive transcriptional repressor
MSSNCYCMPRRSEPYSLGMTARIGRLKAPQVVAALGALAHETRLAAYRLLVEAGPAGLPAGVIAARLNAVPSSLTFHLQALLHARLVTQRRLSRQVIYAADFTAMNALVGFLTEHCCGQDGAACAPLCDPARPAAEGARTRRRSA